MKSRAWQCGVGLFCFFAFSLGLFTISPLSAPGIAARAAGPAFLKGGQAGNYVPAGEGKVIAEAISPLSTKSFVPLIINRYPLPVALKGNLETEDLLISSLAAYTADRWTMHLSAGDIVTISVAPGYPVDIMLSLLDSDGRSLVNRQNLSSTGEVETIAELDIEGAGQYSLLIETVQGKESDYALMLLDDTSYNLVFRGALLDNVSRSDSLPADTDHFWFFNAVEREKVSFNVTPGGGEDAYVALFDPAGARMLTIDDNGDGEPESLENYLLPYSGLYAIRVAEFYFQAMEYEIAISRP